MEGEDANKEHEANPVVQLVKHLPWSQLNYGVVVFLLLSGIMIGVGSFWAGMNLLNESFTNCYVRGGIVKLPLAASGGLEGKNTPIYGYFTTAFGKQYYLVSLGLTKEGPEFDSYYREPLVIMGKKDFERILDKSITAKFKTLKKTQSK